MHRETKRPVTLYCNIRFIASSGRKPALSLRYEVCLAYSLQACALNNVCSIPLPPSSSNDRFTVFTEFLDSTYK